MIYLYRDLERKCNDVDDLMLRTAKASYNGDIFKIFDKMTSFIIEKNTYCNIKVIIDETIKEMDKSAELKLRYIIGLKNKDIADKCNIGERTLYRHLETQIEDLSSRILNKYGELKLYDIISNSKWLMNKYKLFLKEENELKAPKGAK